MSHVFILHSLMEKIYSQCDIIPRKVILKVTNTFSQWQLLFTIFFSVFRAQSDHTARYQNDVRFLLRIESYYILITYMNC